MSKDLPKRAYTRLQGLCKRWGGKIQLLSLADFDRYVVANTQRERHDYDTDPITSVAPASSWHGLCWKTRTIYAVDVKANAGAIIHEMGHTFLDQAEGEVENSDEVEWLGWEIAVARYAGCYKIWSAQNAGYHLGDILEEDDHLEWGSLTRKGELAVIVDRLEYAQDVGYLDRRFRPLSAR